MEKLLTHKVAIVTGASRGIGRQIAMTLAQEGAYVIVNYNGSRNNAENVVNEITQSGGSAEAIQCNVADAAAADNMVKDVIARHGRVDILVNNAGITRDNLIMRMSEQDFDDVINTNLKGAFHTIRSLSRSFLKQRSGKIINIASVVGITGNAGQANYSASKAGIIGLTKSVAREFATRGICVNAVAPGYIETEMTQALSEEATKGLMQMIPMGRAGTAQNVADLVLFLAGSGSDYITGQVIGVNGGMAM